jgi:hypothetical protein
LTICYTKTATSLLFVPAFFPDSRTTMKVQIDERTMSITTRGMDELETYMNGRPFEAVRRISDGAHQLPRPDAEIIELVARRNGEICQRRRLVLNVG